MYAKQLSTKGTLWRNTLLFCFLIFVLGIPLETVLALNVLQNPSASSQSGSGTSWSNTDNIFSQNSVSASADFSSGDTKFLSGSDYGFSIPTGSTIDGIIMTVRRTQDNGEDCRDGTVRLLKDGTATGDDKASATTWPDNGGYLSASYGNSTDLWGTSWTVSDINSTSFGAGLTATYIGGGGSSYPKVDVIQINVFYSVDETTPTVSTLSPVDNATGVAVATNLQITFNETIGKTGTGSVSIYKASDNALVEQIAVTGSLVTGSGTNTITINPTNNLLESTAYYVQISQNAFPDSAGNAYAGISDDSSWTFKTVAAAESSSEPSEEEVNTQGAGGRRGKEGNKRILHALLMRQIGKTLHAAPKPEPEPVAKEPEISEEKHRSPFVAMLLSMRNRLQDRMQSKIDRNPGSESLLRSVLKRMEKRIEELIKNEEI